MQNTVLEYWPQILAIISLIVWLARLEMKVSATDKIEKMCQDIGIIKTNVEWLMRENSTRKSDIS